MKNLIDVASGEGSSTTSVFSRVPLPLPDPESCQRMNPGSEYREGSAGNAQRMSGESHSQGSAKSPECPTYEIH